MTPSGLRPVGLRCEYRADPLGIAERFPELSWALESEGRGQAQSAYRVLIAQSEEDLESEENLLWDSGRVESGRSVGVEYEGEALRSGSRCVWKVRLGRRRPPIVLRRAGRLRDGTPGKFGLGG